MSAITAALVAALLAQPAATDSVPLYTDLGDLQHPITTASPLAQRYFDQGLRLVYAFNHPEAVRSFREAQRLDPSCAMCFWGEALATGPNINVLMDSASGAAAYTAIRRALALAPRASAPEQAYIRALARRYGPNPTADRKALDTAYATAMLAVARTWPRDDDAAVLAAEAQMLLGAWDYWTPDKSPKPHGAAALAALEPVVARSPRHAGACHFFIHAVEAAFPERAVPCAERLPELMPGAGHVVHMPAHIYIRVGRYADAIDRNVHALHADESVIADMAADGVYRLALHPHNGHFLSFAASMIGRSGQALDAARLTKAKVDTSMLRAPGLGALQHYYVLPLYTMVRFARWDDVLAEPALPDDLPYPAGVRHYARAMAFVARRDVASAERELAGLRERRGDPRLAGVTIWDLNPVTALLDIAIEVVSGEIALAGGDAPLAARHFRAGVALEDALTYDEPPPWYAPVRQQLGRALLAAGKPDEAEAAFRRDLDRHPENGWSLQGLAIALAERGARAEAATTRDRFRKAWSTADVWLDENGVALELSSKRATLADGVRLHYMEGGNPDGGAIILLHGYSDSWFSFSRVVRDLMPLGRVLAVDLRGHGASDRPATGYAPREMAVDVLAFMDALGLERARIVGHSMGSVVAQHAAAIAPARVSRLVLIGSSANAANPGMKEFKGAVYAEGDPVSEQFARDFQVSTIHKPVPPAFLEEAIDMSQLLPQHAWRGVIDGLAGDEAAAPLAQITSPTLIIWGTEDAVFSRGEQVALAAGIRGSALEIVEGIGHAVHWEDPAGVVRRIATFLRADVSVR